MIVNPIRFGPYQFGFVLFIHFNAIHCCAFLFSAIEYISFSPLLFSAVQRFFLWYPLQATPVQISSAEFGPGQLVSVSSVQFNLVRFRSFYSVSSVDWISFTSASCSCTQFNRLNWAEPNWTKWNELNWSEYRLAEMDSTGLDWNGLNWTATYFGSTHPNYVQSNSIWAS